MKLGLKIKAIREAEGLSQTNFCKITGLSVSTLKKYETGLFEPGGVILATLLQQPRFTKYTLWLMADQTAPESGQIAPDCAHSGLGGNESDRSEKSIG